MKKPSPAPSRPAKAPAAQSVAGEEDPGASLDTVNEASVAPAPRNPGDDAPPGAPATGEAVCGRCGGSGRVGNAPCPTCGGTGKVVRGIGGA
jgi:hypothetical protein